MTEINAYIVRVADTEHRYHTKSQAEEAMRQMRACGHSPVLTVDEEVQAAWAADPKEMGRETVRQITGKIAGLGMIDRHTRSTGD